jgi:hypothetical protein
MHFWAEVTNFAIKQFWARTTSVGFVCVRVCVCGAFERDMERLDFQVKMCALPHNIFVQLWRLVLAHTHGHGSQIFCVR